MFKKTAQKTSKAILASTIALGGIGIFDALKQEPIAEAAVRSDVDVFSNYHSQDKNAFTTVVSVGGKNSAVLDFQTKHNALFEIRNNSGFLVHRGSLNPWLQNGSYFYTDEFFSFTNISVSSLIPGHYRINVIIPMDDGPLNSTTDTSLTQAFTINSDRTISNIRP